MRKIFFLLSIALFLLSWCCSCTLFSSRDLVLTEKDSGKTLYLQAGDTVTLHLEANPSTGYLWKFASPPYDENVVILRGDRYTRKEELLAGTAGKRILTFVANASGRTGVRLIYVRPWEQNGTPVREFNLLLIVRDGSEEDSGLYEPSSRRNYKGEEIPRSLHRSFP
jgi:predicted secreted protein